MSILEIRNAEKVIVNDLTVEIYERFMDIGNFPVRQNNYPDYNTAKQHFFVDGDFTNILNGILFVFNKTPSELQTIKNTNQTLIICHIIASNYNNDIRKIRIKKVNNEFFFPDGKLTLFPSTSPIYNTPSSGNGGEIFIGSRSEPTNVSIEDEVYTIPFVIADNTTLDIKAKMYEPIRLVNGFKATALRLNVDFTFFDANDNIIRVTKTTVSPTQTFNSLYFSSKIGIGNDIYELKTPVYNGTIIVKNSNSEIVPSGALGQTSITIKTLPGIGTLKLNGTNVTLNQIITIADLEAGKLVYTTTVFDTESFFCFTANTSIPGSTSSDYRVLYLDIR